MIAGFISPATVIHLTNFSGDQVEANILRGVKIVTLIFCIWIAILFVSYAVIKSRVPVSLSPSLSVDELQGYAVAEGTWVIEGDKQAFPLQTTKIECFKDRAICTSATAEVSIGDQLHVNIDQYIVSDWSPTRIVFTDEAPTCVWYVFTMDLLTKSVSGIRQKNKNPTGGNESCQGFNSTLRLSLKDGFSVWHQAEKDATPWFGVIAEAPFKLLQ
jgi:hypothetical protein